MAHAAEACAECTQNCVLMHQKNKNPASIATVFFKVMYGEDYSKIMYLPPKFACTIPNLVGKETQLEDSIGEKWTVKLKQVDGLLAFEEGWNKFSLDHGLRLGDFLVFHYITGSHFVVLMLGHSGCPEIRHFGFTGHQMKNTRKKGKFIAYDPSPSNMNTNGDCYTNKSSSHSESSEIRKNKRIRTDSTPPPSVNINMPLKGKGQRLSDVPFVSDYKAGQLSELLVKHTTINKTVSDKETGQRSDALVKHTTPDNIFTNKERGRRSEPLVKHTNPDKISTDKEMGQRSEPLVKHMAPVEIVHGTPKSVEPFCLVDRDTGNVEDEYRRSCFIDLSVFETCLNGSDGGRKNDILARGGRDETSVNESGKEVATRIEEAVEKLPESAEKLPESAEELPERVEELLERMEKRKEKAVGPPETTKCHNSIKTRLRNASPPPKKMVKAKKAPVVTNDKNEASCVKRANLVKKEPVTSGSRLHYVSSTSDSTGIFQKPADKPIEVIKKELIGRSSGCGSKDTKTGCRNPVKKENNDILLTVKPEPVDYDESPLPGSGNTSFSAVMSTYQYIELPKWVKLQSKVILLRNGGDLWPVLFRSELGLKALTYSWEAFARAKGIEPGDECEFVLESEPNGSLTCSVFRVNVTRK